MRSCPVKLIVFLNDYTLACKIPTSKELVTTDNVISDR